MHNFKGHNEKIIQVFERVKFRLIRHNFFCIPKNSRLIPIYLVSSDKWLIKKVVAHKREKTFHHEMKPSFFFFYQIQLSSCCTNTFFQETKKMKENERKKTQICSSGKNSRLIFIFCLEIGAEMKCFSSHFYALCAIQSETIFPTSFQMKFLFFALVLHMCDIIAPC